MKAVMVMFDTLSRRFLSVYGNEWVKTPNFERLAQKSTVFERFFAGSMPCMPARRELHTGRYNFLHRSWGPIEPFDFSVVEQLKKNGIYTHLVTDHSHYWEDGGSTYHTRYNSWEGFRGQEGDRWVPFLSKEEIKIPNQSSYGKSGSSLYHNYSNRSKQTEEKDMSSVKTIRAGIEFLSKYGSMDNWFLQIECFDPHEPFYVPQKYLEMYDDIQVDPVFDWPSYTPVTTESEEDKKQVIVRYAALITMCDEYLGKILDVFDSRNLWKDTLLIVNTDHGFLLGEHDWWGKNIQPFYNEISHLPFFMYHPQKERIDVEEGLYRTIDIAPTLLEFFNYDIPREVQGVPIQKEKNEHALFGTFGGHVNYTDGAYVYMRSCIHSSNQPLFEYTLMPTMMRGFFPEKNLNKSVLYNGFSFTKGMPVLKVPTMSFFSPYRYGHKLFDLSEDYEQKHPVQHIELEKKYINKLREAMIASEAPKEQYERLGIPIENEISTEDVILQRQSREEAFSIDAKVELNEKELMQLIFIRDTLGLSNEDIVKSFEENLNTNDMSGSIVETFKTLMEKKGFPQDRKHMMINFLKIASRKD